MSEKKKKPQQIECPECGKQFKRKKNKQICAIQITLFLIFLIVDFIPFSRTPLIDFLLTLFVIIIVITLISIPIYSIYLLIKPYECPQCQQKVLLAKYCETCEEKVPPRKAFKFHGYITTRGSGALIIICIIILITSAIITPLFPKGIPIIISTIMVFSSIQMAIISLFFLMGVTFGDRICPNCRKKISPSTAWNSMRA
jgi:hypothetical protein